MAFERPSRPWIGVTPAPAILGLLDYEEMAVFALLAWSMATNRPVTAKDLAALLDRDERKLGAEEVREITRRLDHDFKMASVRGLNNEYPLGIRLGGFQPPHVRRSPSDAPDKRNQNASARKTSDSKGRSGPGEKTNAQIPFVRNDRRVETSLSTTDNTPAYVMEEALKLRARESAIQNGEFGDDAIKAAEARLEILYDRIKLYERWLRDESRPDLPKILLKKYRAVEDVKFRLNQSRIKRAAEQATEGEGEADANG